MVILRVKVLTKTGDQASVCGVRPERFWMSSSLLCGKPRSCSMFSTSSSASAAGRPFNSEKKRMCSATVMLPHRMGGKRNGNPMN